MPIIATLLLPLTPLRHYAIIDAPLLILHYAID
jgi:hypothetical protein